MRIDQYSKRPGGLTGEEELVVVWGRVGNPGDIDYVEGTTWKGTLDEVIALYKASDESDPIFEAWLASDPIKPETNLVNVTNDTNNNILIGINTSNMTMFQSSGAYLTTADGYNILAVPGTTNAITGTVVFSNFNAISFGLNAGTMTASALGSLNFSDANGISWGGSIGTGVSSALTTISISSHGLRYTSADSQLQFTSANTKFAGTGTSATNASITLNSNGLAISVANPGAGGGAVIQGSGTYTQNTGTIQFSNANGVSFGLTAGTMTASHNALTTAMASNQTSNFRYTSADTQLQFTSANSNLLGSAATGSFVFTSQSSLFQHTSATSAITSNAFNTSGSSNFLLTANSSLFQHTSATSAITSAAFPSANTTKFAGSETTTASITGSVLKLTVNSVGVNLGVPAWVTNAAGGGAVLPGDYLSSSVNGVSTAISVTGLQATSATSAITSNAVNTSASSNFRFTSADSQLQFTSANSKFAQSWELEGAQTAGTTGSSQGSILYFSAGNMITLSGSSNTIVFSVNSASLLGTGATQSFRHTSVDSQLQFTSANSNLLGSGATASLVFTSQSSLFQHTSATSAITSNAFNTSGSSNFVLTANSSLLQHTSATSAITSAAFAASATTKFAGSGTSATNATITLNSNGLAISVAAPGAAAEANWINLQGNTASNSTASGSTIMWSAGNNITLAATNGSVIRIDAGGGGGGVAIAGSGASTVTNGTLVFSNANSVSFGLNGSTMTASVPIGTVAFADSNGITFGSSVNGVSTTISASYDSTHSHGNPTLALTNLTGTTASASNGFTLSLSAANPGGGAVYTDNEWHNFTGNSTHLAPGQNIIWYQPFELRNPVSASSLQIGMTFTGTITSAVTAQFGMTQNFMLLSMNASNSTRFDSIWSTQHLFTMWNSGTSSNSWSSNATSSSSAASNLIITQIMGQRIISTPIGSELSAGFYMMAYRQSTSTANYSALLRTYNPVFVAPLPQAKNFIGAQTATSIGHFIGGPYSVSSAAFPASIGVSELRKSNDLRLFFKLGAVS
jgi:hypothetical protein